MIGLNTIYNIGDSLYTYKLGTTQLQPRLATQLPKISSDGLTYDIQIFSNGANLFNAFLTHAIDVAYFSLEPAQIESLKQEALIGKWQVITSPGTTVNYLGLNLRHKPLDNPIVRQAIAMLIDRKLLNQRVLKNQAEPLYSLVPNVFDVYKSVFKTHYGDGNIEKAKHLLKQAGYSSNNPLKLQIWYPSTSTTRGLVAQTLKAFVDQNLGGVMQLEVNTIESTSYLKNIGKGLYQMFLLEWYPDFLDPDNYIQPFVECSEGSLEKGCKEGGSQTLGSFYYKERVNQLIDQERKTQNPKVRAAIFAEIQEIIAEDIPYIPLWQSKNYIFAHQSLIDVNIEPNYSLPFWKIQKSH